MILTLANLQLLCLILFLMCIDSTVCWLKGDLISLSLNLLNLNAFFVRYLLFGELTIIMLCYRKWGHTFPVFEQFRYNKWRCNIFYGLFKQMGTTGLQICGISFSKHVFDIHVLVLLFGSVLLFRRFLHCHQS